MFTKINFINRKERNLKGLSKKKIDKYIEKLAAITDLFMYWHISLNNISVILYIIYNVSVQIKKYNFVIIHYIHACCKFVQLIF